MRRRTPPASAARPLIGICAAIERASWGAWTGVEIHLAPSGYARQVQDSGGVAVILPPYERGMQNPGELLDHLDGLMLAGGSDVDPASYGAEPTAETKGTWAERDSFEIALGRAALEREIPVLGICRGMQMLNVLAGGSLDQHVPDRLGHSHHRDVPGTFSRHEVRIEEGTQVAGALGAGEVSVFSHHHQGVDRLGEGVRASGFDTEDGSVEAIELPAHRYALGVLWHPEEDPTSHVIPSLVEAASDRETAA